MEKNQKTLICLITFLLLVALGIVVYILAIKKEPITDGLKFKKEYESLNGKIEEKTKEEYIEVNVADDNLYVYKSDEEILDVFKKETALIYFGYASCPYCRNMISLLDDLAKENKLDKIYYVDISSIKDTFEVMEGTPVKITNGTSGYYKILDLLDDYLFTYYVTDKNGKEYNTGEKRLGAPTVVAVKDGKIVDIHQGVIDNAKYNSLLTETEEKELKAIYTNMIKKLNN